MEQTAKVDPCGNKGIEVQTPKKAIDALNHLPAVWSIKCPCSHG